MRVVLDGREVASGAQSLGDALRLGVAEANRAGRLIIQASADGRALTNDELTRDDTADFKILELESVEPRELVRATLLAAADALEAAQADQRSAAVLIQAGQGAEAMTALQQSLLTWQAVRDALTRGSELLRTDLGALPIPGIEPKDGIQASMLSLAGVLKELKGATERQDWSALSDILGYDLSDAAEHWRRILPALAEALPSAPGGGA